jgi:hypothetical protein
MTNTNCLEGIKCPGCDNEGRFFITATILADVTDDGADMAKHTDMEWGDESYTRCPDCGRSGALSGFRVEPVPKRRQQQPPDFLAFIKRIARMTQDGEEVDGREFVMERDDAVGALNGLIDEARRVVVGAEGRGV